MPALFCNHDCFSISTGAFASACLSVASAVGCSPRFKAVFNGFSSQSGSELSSFLVDYRIQTLGMNQPEFMDMTLQLAVARGTARGLINGTAAADYGDVICLRRLLLREGEHGLATDLLVLAQTMSPTAAELSEFGPAA